MGLLPIRVWAVKNKNIAPNTKWPYVEGMASVPWNVYRGMITENDRFHDL